MYKIVKQKRMKLTSTSELMEVINELVSAVISNRE
jgi:hypothetical protein